MSDSQGLQKMYFTKDGMLHFLNFEIPHILNGKKQEGICVTITADEDTPTYMWMAKLREACYSVATLIESEGLDKR